MTGVVLGLTRNLCKVMVGQTLKQVQGDGFSLECDMAFVG